MNSSLIICSILCFYIIISSAQAEFTALNRTVCVSSGKVIDGAINVAKNLSTEPPSEPVNGLCPSNKILLEPGVVAGLDALIISSKGYCLEGGQLFIGKIVVVGEVVELDETMTSGEICVSGFKPNQTVFNLREGVLIGIYYGFSINNCFSIMGSYINIILIEVLPADTPPGDVFVVEDKPILANLSYTTQLVTDFACLEGGILIDGLPFSSLDPLNTTSNGSCPTNDSVLLGSGVVLATLEGFEFLTASDRCINNGIITVGRVLSPGSIIPINGTLSSGKICSITLINNNFINSTGLVISTKVILLIPNEENTSTTRSYNRTTYRYYYPKEGSYQAN